ncbi:MAG: [protein-PII] uridylyltransferase [Proteobacteria bacterium]|nr:[protein-PII] uridylyltransferase [Pseudomonadota bacterium]
MNDTSVLKSFIDPSKEITPQVKAYLGEIEEGLKLEHTTKKQGIELCASYTKTIDALLKTLYAMKKAELKCGASTAMVALGGYGRGELNIRSDIDLMLLYKNSITPEIEELTQQLLTILWDTGLDMGFSIRSIDECLELAKEDHKTMTALLDRRFLSGDESLYQELNRVVQEELFNNRNTNHFIEEKLKENAERHARFGGSIFILEPNVKEGEGGLRDVHAARWIINARGARAIEPFSLGLISDKDNADFYKAFDFLLWMRNELHFRANRKYDQLTFDHQVGIAKTLSEETFGTAPLGLKEREGTLPVESFMQLYYSHAANISHCSKLVLDRFLNADKRSSERAKTVDKLTDYAVLEGQLSIRDPELFSKKPFAVMQAFAYAHEQHLKLAVEVKDAILAISENPPEELRTSKESASSFLVMLKSDEPYRALFEMHELRLLEAYIPEFRNIRCRAQHDLYHVYTVDAHTLFAVRELERLTKEHKFDFPLLANIYEELKKPELLVLGVLFHDIGKSEGSGHAEKGAAMMPEICGRLHLSAVDTELVHFLVNKHLILANTAQYRDLSDEQLIIDFAREVGGIQRLNMLYLLTFADVRAVGPDVWSSWKGALFQELYFKTLSVLERGTFVIEEAAPRVDTIRAHVTELLEESSITASVVRQYFRLLPQKYFLSTPHEFIARHIRVLNSLESNPFVMNIRHDTHRVFTELVICTHDVHGLFSKITGVLAANGVDILGAEINTLRNGIVLDVLQVTNSLGELLISDTQLEKVESDLEDVITCKINVETLSGLHKKASILDSRPTPDVEVRVSFDNEVSETYTVLDLFAPNRVGLLYDVSSVLNSLGLFIRIAKISTKGSEASDIFYVKDIFGQKIYWKERLQEIREELCKQITERGKGMA